MLLFFILISSQQPSVLFTPEDRILKQKVTISQQANTGTESTTSFIMTSLFLERVTILGKVDIKLSIEELSLLSVYF